MDTDDSNTKTKCADVRILASQSTH